MEDVEALCQAIIVQAVKDYRAAAQKLKTKPNHAKSMTTISDVETLLGGSWVKNLTNVDGAFILRKLREEVEQ